MVSGQETVFCWVSVPQLIMVVNSELIFYYLSLVGCQQQVGSKNNLCINHLLTQLLYIFLPIYLNIRNLLSKLVTKVKPNITSVEVHPQLSNNGHPVDGALVDAGSLWPNSGVFMNSGGLSRPRQTTTYTGTLVILNQASY